MRYKTLAAILAAMMMLCSCEAKPVNTPVIEPEVTITTAEPADRQSQTATTTEATETEVSETRDQTAETTAEESISSVEETTSVEETAEVTDETTEEATAEEAVENTEAESDISDIEFIENEHFFLVNHEYPLPDDYEVETDYVQGSYELEVTAAKYCRDMIEAAKEDGIELKVLSAYRTVSYQKKLFERNIKSRMEKYGWSYDEAYADVLINIALPGTSEHNAGLAVDIVTEDDWDTYEAFDQTEEYRWLQENAADYGFILRYLKDKTDITGYIYEPWHYRYVGVEYAAIIRDSGLCLEEFFEEYVWADDSAIDQETEEN